MKKLLLFLLTALLPFLSLGQPAMLTILDETFEGNVNRWETRQGKYLYAELYNGEYQLGNELHERYFIHKTIYLKPEYDFRIAIIFIPDNLHHGTEMDGSHYGLAWDFEDADNYSLFYMKSNRYGMEHFSKGKKEKVKGQRYSMRWRKRGNELQVAKRGNLLEYSFNGKVVETEPYRGLRSERMAIMLGEQSGVRVDRITVEQYRPDIITTPSSPFLSAVQPLQGVNTGDDELAPNISPDGRNIFFTRMHRSESGDPVSSNIYQARALDSTLWASPVALPPPVNSGSSNYVNKVFPDGSMLLGNIYGRDGSQRSGASQTRLDGMAWTFPDSLRIQGYLNQSQYSEFTMANNREKLIFTAERPEGQGKLDMYISFRQPDGSYSRPQNLGPGLNSSSNELSPFLAPDDRTLYFASHGLPGFGAGDVFMSRRLDDTWLSWSRPMNLGQQINTINDEAYFTLPASGSFAYFSSYRNDARSDIYRIEVPESMAPEPVVLLSGKVTATQGRKRPMATVTYSTGEEGENGSSAASANGEYQVILPVQRTVRLTASAPGFISQDTSLSTLGYTGYREQQIDIALSPIEFGKVYPVGDLHFERNTATMLPGAKPSLNSLAEWLTANPNFTLELRGHTESQGSSNLLQDLSDQRVETVKTYLTAQGIAAGRISGKGYGGTRPLVPGANEESQVRNRRVEIVVNCAECGEGNSEDGF